MTAIFASDNAHESLDRFDPVEVYTDMFDLSRVGTWPTTGTPEWMLDLCEHLGINQVLGQTVAHRWLSDKMVESSGLAHNINKALQDRGVKL